MRIFLASYMDCKRFLILYNTIISIRPDLKHYLPRQEDYENIFKTFEKLSVQDYTLKGALEHAFGGKQYILTNCITKSGIPIGK